MSVKTKALNMCETGGDVIVRGPYRNGIIGLDRRISESRILIIASGAGIMPAVFTSNILAAHNSVDIIAGTGVIEKKILRHYITDDRYTGPDDITFREYDDIKLTEQIRQKSYDEIIILGSIHFVETLKPLIRQISNAHISCSNNSIMTCGEGICGACAGTDKNGKTVLRCKCTEFDI
jgi:NAD(P)H-flavin reductase